MDYTLIMVPGFVLGMPPSQRRKSIAPYAQIKIKYKHTQRRNGFAFLFIR